MPEEFCLTNNTEKSLELITQLRQAALIEAQPVRLDFSDTTAMSAVATLLLYSMVDYILTRTDDHSRIVMAYPADAKMEQICQQIGLLERLRMVDRLNVESFSEDVSRWKVQYGNLVEAKEIYEFIVDVLQDAGKPTVDRYNKGLKEAIGNCVEHAYIDANGDQLNEKYARWWMFGGIMDDHIVFVVCDLGLGIPRTLGIRNNISDLKHKAIRWPGKFDFRSDSGRIEIACRLGKSRIGEAQGRGRGMAQLINLMQFSSKSNLCIWSNKGLAVYSSLKGKKPNKERLKYSVRGTLISWSSPILN